jgi:hypothetical protein
MSEPPEEPLEVPRAEHYPPWVASAEERHRWDLCAAISEAMYADIEGSAAVIWQMTRSLYSGEIPT